MIDFKGNNHPLKKNFKKHHLYSPQIFKNIKTQAWKL